MSLFETGDSNGLASLKDICAGKKIDQATGDVDIRNLAKFIIRGGWPANF